MEERAQPTSKTADYVLQVPTDGQVHSSDFGSRIPIQTTVNNTISRQYVAAGTSVLISAQLMGDLTKPNAKRKALIVLNVHYDQVLERLATLSSQPSAPYVDTTQFDTALVIPEATEKDVFGYEDQVVGRKFKVTLSWIQIEAPQEPSSTPSTGEMIRCRLSFTDVTRQGSKAVNQWLLLAVDGKPHKFLTGVLLPMETTVNNTVSVQLAPFPIGATIQVLQPDLTNNPPSGRRAFSFKIDVQYVRLRERPFATKAELPYSEEVKFRAFPSSLENQEQVVYRADEAIRGRKFEARFMWDRQAP